MSKLKINLEPVIKCLPKVIANAVLKYDVEEIRLTLGQPVMLYIEGSGFFVSVAGDITASAQNSVVLLKRDIADIFRLICNNSVYSAEEEIKCGYVTLEGGHRVGICGSGVIKNGELFNIKNISALNIRVAKQAIDASKNIMPMIVENGIVKNTLIVSPPGCGKTTMLRDIARVLSDKYKIGIADERSEIAAVYQGVAQNEIGIRSVVMDACPKTLGINMMIRSMGIEIVITDEIGSADDAVSIRNAINSGVKIIASAHGYTHKDMEKKENIRPLLGGDGFERIITLSRRKGAGTLEEVVDCGN